MPSNPPPFQILPCTSDDAPAIMAMGRLAFANDALHQSSFPEGDMTPEQDKEYMEWRMGMFRQRLKGENRHYVKGVIDGQIVGFMAWHGPTAPTTSDAPSTPPAATDPSSTTPAEATQSLRSTRYPNPPSFLPTEHFDSLSAAFSAKKEKLLGTRTDFWFLQSMCVHPGYQGRGIAGQLMTYGCELIDADVDADGKGRDAYLEASAAPGARKLYERFGFEVKETIEQLEGKYVIGCMLREGRRKEEK